MRWLDSTTDSMDMRQTLEDREGWGATVQRVAESQT